MSRQQSSFNISNIIKSFVNPRSTSSMSRLSAVAATALLVGSAGVMEFSTLASASETPQARTVYVNPSTGSDRLNAGTQNAPYRTISYALQQSTANTVVQLSPGTYSAQTGESFPLVVKPGVTVKGDAVKKGQGIRIVGGGTFISPTFARQNTTILAENNSRINGVTVTNPNVRGTGLWIESANAVVKNSTFSESKRDGIFVSGNSRPTIRESVFSKNEGNGISIVRSSQGEIRANLFQDTGFGIAVNDTASPLIVENKIVKNRDGVVISQSAKPVLRSNAIENNVRDGVVAITLAQPDLGTTSSPGKNVIRGNGRYDIYNATRGKILLAVGNQVSQNGISGSVNIALK